MDGSHFKSWNYLFNFYKFVTQKFQYNSKPAAPLLLGFSQSKAADTAQCHMSIHLIFFVHANMFLRLKLWLLFFNEEIYKAATGSWNWFVGKYFLITAMQTSSPSYFIQFSPVREKRLYLCVIRSTRVNRLLPNHICTALLRECEFE